MRIPVKYQRKIKAFEMMGIALGDGQEYPIGPYLSVLSNERYHDLYADRRVEHMRNLYSGERYNNSLGYLCVTHRSVLTQLRRRRNRRQPLSVSLAQMLSGYQRQNIPSVTNAEHRKERDVLEYARKHCKRLARTQQAKMAICNAVGINPSNKQDYDRVVEKVRLLWRGLVNPQHAGPSEIEVLIDKGRSWPPREVGDYARTRESWNSTRTLLVGIDWLKDNVVIRRRNKPTL